MAKLNQPINDCLNWMRLHVAEGSWQEEQGEAQQRKRILAFALNDLVQTPFEFLFLGQLSEDHRKQLVIACQMHQFCEEFH